MTLIRYLGNQAGNNRLLKVVKVSPGKLGRKETKPNLHVKNRYNGDWGDGLVVDSTVMQAIRPEFGSPAAKRTGTFD